MGNKPQPMGGLGPAAFGTSVYRVMVLGMVHGPFTMKQDTPAGVKGVTGLTWSARENQEPPRARR